MLEWRRRTQYRQHAAHSGRYFRVFHVQFHIGRELSLMALRTEVIRTQYPRRAYHGEYWPGAQFLVLRMMSTRTWQATLIRGRDFVLQQFAQGGCSGLVEGGSQCALHGFQIGSAAVAALREDTDQ
jgi:hypothetical protein